MVLKAAFVGLLFLPQSYSITFNNKFIYLPASIIQTDLSFISRVSIEKQEENDNFILFIKRQNGKEMDTLVQELNNNISKKIDCTECGNCCKTLVINVTHEEVNELAVFLDRPVSEIKKDFIEESLAGNCFINSIPCHFLKEKKCSIYENRFTECREFPHLHKNGFKERLSGIMLHYGSCPIIYNVIEEVKITTGFISSQD
jgi:uncharacterized protein